MLLADQALRGAETLRLQVTTMSDAMRGYLLDPLDGNEIRRKAEADAALEETVGRLRSGLSELPENWRWSNESRTSTSKRSTRSRSNDADDRCRPGAGSDVLLAGAHAVNGQWLRRFPPLKRSIALAFAVETKQSL